MLHHKIYGTGEPVLILHGLFGFSDNWQTIAKALGEQYMVITPDLRNHGRSFHAPEHTYDLMAEDLREFMHDNWIHSARVIGHSMGGKAAMQLALSYPDLVEKLVSVDMAPFQNASGHEDIFAALRSIDLDAVESREAVDQQLQKTIPDLGVRLFLMKNLSRKKYEPGFEWKMNLPALWNHYPDILQAIHGEHPYEGPTLFVGGSRSNYINSEDFPLIQNLFPNAELTFIEGAGHWVHADKPSELLEVLQRFLA